MANGPDDIPGQLRNRIFDTVLAELVDSGIDEFSITAVALRAGVDRRVIDRYWPDDRVLLMDAVLARAGTAIPVSDQGSLGRDLQRFVGALAELTDTTFGRQCFRSLLPGGRDVDLSDIGSDFWAAQMAAVDQIFQRAVERGEVRGDIDRAKATHMLAAALAYDLVFTDSPINREYADEVCSIFLHGMLTSGSSGLLEDFHKSEQTRALLRVTCDGIMDPVTLVEAVRDSDGRIVDFVFREVNPAACTYLRRSRTELLGATITETLPDVAASGALARYVQAMETGNPLKVDDFPYFSRLQQTTRRVDLRAMPANADWLSVIWRDVSDRYRDRQMAQNEVAGRLMSASKAQAGASPDELAAIAAAEALRAAADALPDPLVLLEVKRDTSGQIVDFVYQELNQATCDYLGMSREQLLGRGVVETMPGLKGELLADYIRCLETGEPLILNDFAYDNEILQDTRRYDLRVTRASPHSLALTWRDITHRFQTAQNLARSRDLLRASADAMLDPQALVEIVSNPGGDVDLVFRDVNAALCNYLSLTRSDLVDQSMLAFFPNVAASGLMTHYVHCAETGERVILDDFEYFAEFVNEPRRFDIRATQVDIGLVSLVIRDTTARFEAAQRLAASEQRYRLLAENAGDLIAHVREGKVVWASPSLEPVLGAPPEYWIGREIQEIIPPEDRSQLADNLAILANGGTVRRRVRVVSLDGVAHWMDSLSRPFYDADGRQDGFIGALRVIDEEVAAEAAAQEARVQQARADARYRKSVENAAIGMCLVAPDGRFLEVNDSLCRFFGYGADTLTAKTWQELTAPAYLEADQNKVNDVLDGRLEAYRIVKQYVHANGGLIWGDLSVSCIRDAHGAVEYFISQITDITAHVEAEQRLQRLARIDALTGLANRAEVIESMDSALASTRGPRTRLGVLFCDVDDFKGINDKFGHAVGDAVLTTLASRIRNCVREDDMVGRMGGDEMLVLLPGVHSIDEVTRIAENIRRNAAEPVHTAGRTITATLSIGAVLAAPGQTASTVLARADSAMYEAKTRRNAVTSFPFGGANIATDDPPSGLSC